MTALNEPTGWNTDRRDETKWTPAIGLRRAAIHGLIAATCATLLLLPVAKYAPLLLFVIWLRVALAFLVTWILMGVVQNAAGMVGWACTALSLGLTAMVLVSTQIAAASFATAANGMSGGGLVWVSGADLLVGNFTALIGAGFAAALCHRGGAGAGVLTDILMQTPFGFRRR